MKIIIGKFEDEKGDWGDVAGLYYVGCSQQGEDEFTPDYLEAINLCKMLNVEPWFHQTFADCNGVTTKRDHVFKLHRDAVKFAGLLKSKLKGGIISELNFRIWSDRAMNGEIK
jgi:hypothetical protein